METAIKKLEVLLTKTENDVDNLSVKLDQEFAALNIENGVQSDMKLSQIMKNVRDLRSELEKVTLEIEEFQKNQKEIITEVRDRLSKVSDQFEALNIVAENEEEDS